MIDLRLVRDDPDRVRASQRARGEDEAAVDALLAADDQRRTAVTRADALRAEQKAMGRAISAATPVERPHLLTKARHLADEVKSAEADEVEADAALRQAHLAIANVVQDGVPPGDERNSITLETVGTPPQIEHPRDHMDIGTRLRAIDTERGAKVSGSRFYFLTGVGAQLEIALVNLAMAQVAAAGLIPVIAPA
ncbi:MAG TPA: serine--tRNA ligase, partial [Jatrophihabitantaceae bacterium]|nr:serine--tRNA ligase [Jatrophihabitantaceae bacterium]